MTVSSLTEIVGLTLVAQERIPAYNSPSDREPIFYIEKGSVIGEVYTWVGPHKGTGGNVWLQFGDYNQLIAPFFMTYKHGRFDYNIVGVTYKEKQAENEDSVLVNLLGLRGDEDSPEVSQLIKQAFGGILVILVIILLIRLTPYILPKRQ